MTLGLRSIVALACCAFVLAVPSPLVSGELSGDGTRPDETRAATLLEAVCDLRAAKPVCHCPEERAPARVIRVHRGSYSAAETDELLTVVRGCGSYGTALLRRRAETWRARRFYRRLRTASCKQFQRRDAHDVLVCHEVLSSDAWTFGWFESIAFAGGTPTRRQLTVYESNAGGCPEERLRTTHPVEWRRWQVAGDPRPPLLTVRFQHRNADVPEKFSDACAAMEQGRPVFGPRHIRTEYFALRGGRFRFTGATRTRVGESARRSDGRPGSDAPADAERRWTSDRRLRAPVCRRDDLHANVRQRRGALEDCYRRALREDRELRGELSARITVRADGEVGSVSYTADGVGSETLRTCVRRVVRTFDLPPPRGAERCHFVYPFDFRPSSENSSARDSPPEDAS